MRAYYLQFFSILIVCQISVTENVESFREFGLQIEFQISEQNRFDFQIYNNSVDMCQSLGYYIQCVQDRERDTIPQQLLKLF